MRLVQHIKVLVSVLNIASINPDTMTEMKGVKIMARKSITAKTIPITNCLTFIVYLWFLVYKFINKMTYGRVFR